MFACLFFGLRNVFSMSPLYFIVTGLRLKKIFNIILIFLGNLKSIMSKILSKSIVNFYRPDIKEFFLKGSFPLCEGVSCLFRM